MTTHITTASLCFFSIKSLTLIGSSLSGTTERARTTKPCPYFLWTAQVSAIWRAPAAGSSTFASRRNFAASSGGVGLM